MARWSYTTSKYTILEFYKPENFDKLRTSGLYYKHFTIVIYNRNVIGQYYKTTIVAKASPS